MSETRERSAVATATSRANASWEGDLVGGRGLVSPASGAFSELPVSWAKRTARSDGATSPEELMASAHASCFSMALANVLAKAGHAPDRLETSAEFDFVPGSGITEVRLAVRGQVPGVDGDEFRRYADDAKANCPVSKALSANLPVRLEASLAGG